MCIPNREVVQKPCIYGDSALSVLEGIRSILGGGAVHHGRHWSTRKFEKLPRLLPRIKLRFEKLDFIREFAVPVPQANKKFPQTATVVARTAKRSITIKF
jgi:hypothetical protein